jgi:GDP-L-fucose synthase
MQVTWFQREEALTKQSRIFVAGHTGLVGSAIVRKLDSTGHSNVILRTRAELDLTRQAAVDEFFRTVRPEIVILAAARVGGILANDSYPVEFLRDNLLIETNVIDAAYRQRAQKLLFLGSSCMYPKRAPQPIREEHLLTGTLESTNEWYAVAKIAGLKLAQAYRRQYGFAAISLMPTNLYGPGDRFEPLNSHVLPALIGKFHKAKVTRASQVVVWGTGTPRREFLHVDDLADACLFLLRCYDSAEPINVGTGLDISIGELAHLIAEIVGYHGQIVYDPSRPDGTPRKWLDVSRLSALGWRATIGLREGITQTYSWFLDQQASEPFVRSEIIHA